MAVLITSGFAYCIEAQNTTASGNVTGGSQPQIVNKEIDKVLPDNPEINSNTTAAVPEINKTIPSANLSFDRWSILFQCRGEWKEWGSQESAYAKDSLNEQLSKFDIEMLEFTMLTNPEETAAIIISKSLRQNPIIIEELVNERENVYKDAKVAGDVTQVNKIEQTTIDNKPAVVEDVERSTGGRAISMKIVSGQKIFEISLIIRDKKDFDSYRPVFEEILKTIRIPE
jgi:hypothetical protein